MARLYPPITEEALPAFCLTYDDRGEKRGALIKINFQMNQAVASSEIIGIALRLRTISTNDYVITEQLNKNPNFGENGLSEGEAIDYNLEDGIATFSITNEYNPLALEKLRVGQYYKAQLAYIGIDNVIGYWSTIATIKCVAKPEVTINNYNSNDVNIFSNEIIGCYQQDITMGDTTEKAYSYKFILYDSDMETVYDETKVLIHNSSNDENNNSSTDTFYCYKELEKNKIYYLRYYVTTINGLEVSSPIYQVINIGSIPPEDDIGLFVFNGTEANYVGAEDWFPFEEGVIKLYIDFNTAEGRLSKQTVTGNFVITRSSSKDNFTSWQEIRRFRLGGVTPSTKIIYDYTVEQGVSYRYAVQQYNREHFYSDKVYAYERDMYSNLILGDDNQPIIKETKADFEDMFLYDGKRQLKIKFNPKVSSFKNDLQEQKIDTIGSKYPFIFRNGNVCYKEFPISGLISFQQDDAFLFISDEDYAQMGLQRFETDGTRFQPPQKKYQVLMDANDRYNKQIPLYKKEIVQEPIYKFSETHENLKNQTPIGYKTSEKFILASNKERMTLSLQELYKDVSVSVSYDIDRSKTYSKTDLTSENFMSERYFKLSVLDWLTDGKPKLFRSSSEGNYIVRLLNVSLSPSDQLGRMLHTFTCTAYEIADFDYNSLKELGLLTIQDSTNELEFEWFSSNIIDLVDLDEQIIDEDYYAINIGNNKLFSFECINFAPGDKIKITTQSNPIPLVIIIGQTGTYIYENSEPILSLSICPSGGWGSFSRDIMLKTEGYKYRPFDMIASINLHTQYGEQIIGKMNNFFAPTVVQSGLDIADQVDTNYYTRKYYEANNVSLAETFEPVNNEEMSKELFNSGTFYYRTKEGKQKIYHFANSYNPDQHSAYYKRILKGTKIMPFDLLYLHAKKREVIPIFASFNLGFDDIFYTGDIDDAIFSLTPFGNGYVRYSSICKTHQWIDDANLTEEERTKAYTVKDLVDLSLSQFYNLDKFCLFELYVPKEIFGGSVSAKMTDWVPYSVARYSPANPATFTGIFDPYLYNKILKDPKLSVLVRERKITFPGWWRPKIEGTYDPSFIVSYGEYENKKTEHFSLEDDVEITLKNLTLPSDLTINNGIVMELIYRIKYIDYTIENEDALLSEQKQNYLKVSQSANDATSNYRFAQYGSIIKSILTEKQEDLVSRLNKSEGYKTVLKNLTEQIRTDQIDKIYQYLQSENNLIQNLTTEIEFISDELGYDNNIKELLEPVQTDYASFVETALAEENILPSLNSYTKEDYIATLSNSIEESLKKIEQDTKKKIYFYLQNQKNNGKWDFAQILTNIIKIITDKKDTKSESLTKIGNEKYTSQYINKLNSQKGESFFIYLSPSIDGENVYSNSYPISQWINKQMPPEGFENIPSIYVTWGDYFHVSDGENTVFNQLQLQEDIQAKKYVVNYLGDYIDLDSGTEKLDGMVFTEKLIGQNDTVLKLIQNKLEILNTDYAISSKDLYEEKYGKDSFDSNEKPFLFEVDDTNNLINLKFLQLATIVKTEEGIEQLFKQPNGVEAILDNLFSSGAISQTTDKNLLFTQIKSTFKNSYKFLKQVPDLILDPFIEQVVIKNYIQSGLREQYQKAYTYQTYQQKYQTSLTDVQYEYLNTTLKNLIREIKNKKKGLDNAFDRIEQLIEQWKIDWETTVSDTKVVQLKNEINNYINIFNQIIKAKNSAIEKYRETQEEILTIQNDPDISASSNIKEIYWKEWEAYDTALKELTQIESFFKETYNELQKENYILAYSEFLKDYLRLCYIDDSETIDTDYQEYLQQLSKYLNVYVNEEESPYQQKDKKIKAWKIFLDSLASKYNKMS